VDLDVELPKDSIVATATSRGDTSITGLAGDVAVQSAHGDVDVHNCAANVAVDLEDGDAHITDVGGNVSTRGHGSDLEVGNVRGNAAVDGRFKGTALLRSIGGTAIFATGPTGITIDRLAGQMEIDSDSIALSDAAGSVKIATKNKDIDAENVEGALQIANVHADIKVRLAKPPSQAITISNQSGGVDLTLPSKSSFTILATSTSGEVQSDFDAPALSLQNSSGSGKLSGTIGSGGPQLRITTSYGTISLLKSF
jgi:DUF4097 and DUF4098 domain-containing protein YvlB